MKSAPEALRDSIPWVAAAAILSHAGAFWLTRWGDSPWGVLHQPQLTDIEIALAVGGLAVAAGLEVLWLRHVRVAHTPPPLETREILLWAFLNLLLVVVLGEVGTDWTPITDDEEAYVLQGHLLLQGRWIAPTVLPPGTWSNPFILDLGIRDGVPMWGGLYPIMAGLWTAPGIACGFPNLLWAPLGALIVVETALLGRKLFGDGGARLATMVTATSPLLISLCTVKHTSVLVTALSLGVALLVVRRRTLSGDILLGVLLGLSVHTRPVEGAMLLVSAGSALVYTDGRRPGVLVGRFAAVALGGSPLAWLFFAHNTEFTGSALKMPSTLGQLGGSYGFVHNAMGSHTPARGISFLFQTMVRLNMWAFAWPAALVLVWRTTFIRSGLAWVLLGAFAMHLLVYWPAPFLPVSAMGGTYSVWLVPVLAMMLAALTREDPGTWTVRAIVWTALGYLTFVPWQVARLSEEARWQRAPFVAAEEIARDNGPIVAVSMGNLRRWCCVFHPPIPWDRRARVVWASARDDASLDRIQSEFPHRALWHVAANPTAAGPAIEATKLRDPITKRKARWVDGRLLLPAPRVEPEP